MKWAHDLFDRAAVAAAQHAVGTDEAWRLIEHFSTLVRESGSDDERRGTDYIRERLESFGLSPVVHEPELYLSVPRGSSLEVLGEAPLQLECKVPAFATSTEGEPFDGELVAVSTDKVTSTAALFTAEASSDLSHVAGKIVLAHGYAMPKLVRQFEHAGAAGAIFINPGHAHEGIITPIWGTPGLNDRDKIPDFLALCVPKAVGEQLHARLAAGGCRVRIRTELFRGWAPCPLVVVDIPGTDPDFVFIHGHHDSWHVGIGDNAVGDAALLEIARVAHCVRGRLRRGIRVAWWPGHSTGRYAGSTWYADEFAMDLRDHCVAQIDVDSPGCHQASAYDEVMWMEEAAHFAKLVIREVAGVEAQGMRPLRAGDYSFNQIGLTGFFMLLSNVPKALAAEQGYYPVGGCGGNSNAWHTEGDTLEVADRDNLERDTRVYVEAVVRLATAAFLPFDYRATVREIAATAADYAAQADGAFDVGPLVTECDALLADLERFYGAAEDAASGLTAAEAPAGFNDATALHSLDRLQMALARELVPVNYARRRYFHDPALETPAVPDLAGLRQWPRLQGDIDGRGFLLADATRGRNRVTDAIKRARERLAPALAER